MSELIKGDFLEYRISQHIIDAMRGERSHLEIEWIERAIAFPEKVEEQTLKTIVWKRIPEFNSIPLKVVYNHKVKPIIVITAHFNGRMKRKL